MKDFTITAQVLPPCVIREDGILVSEWVVGRYPGRHSGEYHYQVVRYSCVPGGHSDGDWETRTIDFLVIEPIEAPEVWKAI